MRTAFLLAIGLVLAAPANAEIGLIGAVEAHQQVDDGALILVDVRRPDEWARTGLPEGAVGATLQDEDFIAQVLAAVGGDKDQPVALICRTGRRSNIAARRGAA